MFMLSGVAMSLPLLQMIFFLEVIINTELLYGPDLV
jgi:hypothetical protein